MNLYVSSLRVQTTIRFEGSYSTGETCESLNKKFKKLKERLQAVAARLQLPCSQEANKTIDAAGAMAGSLRRSRILRHRRDWHARNKVKRSSRRSKRKKAR